MAGLYNNYCILYFSSKRLCVLFATRWPCLPTGGDTLYFYSESHTTRTLVTWLLKKRHVSHHCVIKRIAAPQHTVWFRCLPERSQTLSQYQHVKSNQNKFHQKMEQMWIWMSVPTHLVCSVITTRMTHHTHTGCVWTQPQHHLLTLWENGLAGWAVDLFKYCQSRFKRRRTYWNFLDMMFLNLTVYLHCHQADTMYAALARGNFRCRNGWKINVTWGITHKFPLNSGTFDKIIIHEANLACLSPTSHFKVQNRPVLLKSTCYNGATCTQTLSDGN